jgi:hypothetical protein
MLRLSAVVAIVAFVFVPACSQTSPAADTTANGTPVTVTGAMTYAELVGTWRFVYTDAHRVRLEALLASKISDPQRLEEAKKEAAAEARSSEIELTPDHRFVSRIYDKPVLEESFEIAGERPLKLVSPSHPDGVSALLRDANTLVLSDPKKGELVFTRVR